jgi:predicted O-methyltransferase YrrM
MRDANLIKKLLSPAAWKRIARRLRQSAGVAPRQRRCHSGVADSISAEDLTTLNADERWLAARTIAADIEFILPTRALKDILPGADLAEVRLLPRIIRSHLWAMPEHELLTLGAIIRMVHPQRVVEFGTFQGGSTLVMAANMECGGRVVTIDLDPSQRETHEHGLGTGLLDFDVGCLFRGTRYAPMIEQRFSNTLHVDAHDLVGSADLVFIDADHTYPFVKRDTAKALTFVRPGGWLLWHDYTWERENSECAGVTKAVNEFFLQHGECFHIAGTRFAIHRVASATTALRSVSGAPGNGSDVRRHA